MPRQRKHDDRMDHFAYRVFQIKLIVFESAMLAVFLYFVLKLLKGEFGL
jgi:hypothetical protein